MIQPVKLQSYAYGTWVDGTSDGVEVVHAVTGAPVARVSADGLAVAQMLDYGHRVANPKLRALTIHTRARMLKALAKYLMERKDELYALSAATGATKMDSWIDIEGGIGTLFSYASKARKELPDESFVIDGNLESLSKTGTFAGHHICVPLTGVAVHINAFNFPCWGLLEKLAPTFIAGMPTIAKPATATAYLAERLARMIIASGILPEGSLQIICGSVGKLFDSLTCQDIVTFTGSASTGLKLKQHPVIMRESIRFNMESDSLNCCILGPDAVPGTDEFTLFIKEVAREMTVKAGQKCTAIRRAIVPARLADDVASALKQQLSKSTLGDPSLDGVRMGPLVNKEQVDELRASVTKLRSECTLVHGDPDNFNVVAGDRSTGAYFPSLLLRCDEPLKRRLAHDIEPFGPVSTLMPYNTVEGAIEIARLGRGSLVGSLFTNDNATARTVVLGCAPFHGRMLVVNRTCAAESTGHGSPMPGLVHGGPGRAGGGEELGGMRAVMHYMQRTAIQSSPATLSAICGQWLKGATKHEDRVHPFRKYFEELAIGDALLTKSRTVTEADVVNFAAISGDHFYAHMDEAAARASMFGQRVAHGYFVLSAAAGLFVDPAPGPVLANYGLENLRFTKPVFIGDTIRASLVCKQKTKQNPRENESPRGVVAWDVEVTNQANETVAVYTILTLVACKPVGAA